MVTLYFYQRANTRVYFLYAITNIVVSITFIFDSNNAKVSAFPVATLQSALLQYGLEFHFFFFSL